MRIANPLYDNAFKYLMSNDRLAKKVLSTILEREVFELELSQQEVVVEGEKQPFTLYRLDFKAVIADKNGNRQTVLIELQKSKLPTNALRFRSYLGHAYFQRKEASSRIAVDKVYPIISIYIMGYNLEDIPALATKVDRKIVDLSTHQEMDIKSDFIELLTHTCYILQVRRLPEQRRTRIEKFLTLFNQAWVQEERFILDLAEVPEEFEDIAQHLQRPLLDDSTRVRLSAEQEVYDMFSITEAEIAYFKQNWQDTAEKLEDTSAKLEDTSAKLEDTSAKLEDTSAKLEQQQQRLLNTARLLLESGTPVDKIAAITGLSVAVIRNL